MSQQTLFSRSIMRLQFERFHKAHPEVAVELARLAQTQVDAGRTRLGIKQLFEVLRYNRSIAGLPDETEPFKLNNNYTAFYARLLMDTHPSLNGLFETRRQVAA